MILGAGPIGLESLLRALADGWDAKLYERGRIGENVRAWGHVRMFSPLAMNLSEAGTPHPAAELAPDTLLTGAEYVERCLEPLAARVPAAAAIFTGTEAVAISRGGWRKGVGIARPERGLRPFRLLLRRSGREWVEEADVVLDATGTFGTHNWLGPGGIPAVGERAVEAEIDYRVPDILGAERAGFSGSRILVVGAGHSAATAILWLAELAREDPQTRVTWVTASAAERPVVEVAGDPLAERGRVAAFANAAGRNGATWLSRLAASSVVEVRREGRGLAAAVVGGGSPRWIAADRLLALVGYRPDLELTRELQVQTCWATEGTYPLAAALLTREADAASDCLRAGAGLGSSTLAHPEPDFFTVGAKSYGRNPNFLIRAGLEQLEDLFSVLRSRVA